MIETLLQDEVRRLHGLEGGLVAVFDRMDGRAICRKVAVTVIGLIETADRHLTDLDLICTKEGWETARSEPDAVRAWREEVECESLDAPRSAATDAVTLALLRRAVHLKLPCYESARLFAFYAERPLIARTLRLALEDEQRSLERLKSAAELGVSLRAALGGGSLTPH